jgi:hypothetical protein
MRLKLQFRDRDVALDEGEFARAVEQCPRSDDETHVLVIDPATPSKCATPA